jgi:hypothetical protein
MVLKHQDLPDALIVQRLVALWQRCCLNLSGDGGGGAN